MTKLYAQLRYAKMLDRMAEVFFILRNPRRKFVLQQLYSSVSTVDDLQTSLSSLRFEYKSATKISEAYINPLVKLGLVKRGQKKLSLSKRGKQTYEVLREMEGDVDWGPKTSGLEEILLLQLSVGGSYFSRLVDMFPKKTRIDLWRTLRRLQSRDYVEIYNDPSKIYFRGRPRNLTKTEKTIYNVVPSKHGISATDLRKSVSMRHKTYYGILEKMEAKDALEVVRGPRVTSKGKGKMLAYSLRQLVNLLAPVSYAHGVKTFERRITAEKPRKEQISQRPPERETIPPKILVRHTIAEQKKEPKIEKIERKSKMQRLEKVSEKPAQPISKMFIKQAVQQISTLYPGWENMIGRVSLEDFNQYVKPVLDKYRSGTRFLRHRANPNSKFKDEFEITYRTLENWQERRRFKDILELTKDLVIETV